MTVIDLRGPDGNIFAVMAIAGKQLTKEEKQKMVYEVTNQKSYEDALAVVVKYVPTIEFIK